MLTLRLSCLFLAAACGTPTTFADAGPDVDGGDDPVDASGERGPVTVHVTSITASGAPDTDATVYFADAAGALIETVTTDRTGTAIGEVGPGGSVTVAFSEATYPTWRSVMGVELGDELWFGERARIVAGTMSVTVPAATGGTSYRVVGACASSIQGASTNIGVTLTSGCSATRSLLAVADRGAMPDQYLPIPDATPANGATLSPPGPWLDELAGLPAEITGIHPDATSRSAAATWWSDGHPVFGQIGALGAGDPAAATLTRPPGLDEGVTAILNASGPGWGYQIQRYLPAVPASTLSIDATPILPVLDPQEVANGITWTSTEGVADAIFVATEELGEKGQTVALWDFIVPPDADGVVFPALPGRPAPSEVSVRVSEIDVVDSYDALRARAAMGEWPMGPPLPSPDAYELHVAFY